MFKISILLLLFVTVCGTFQSSDGTAVIKDDHIVELKSKKMIGTVRDEDEDDHDHDDHDHKEKGIKPFCPKGYSKKWKKCKLIGTAKKYKTFKRNPLCKNGYQYKKWANKCIKVKKVPGPKRIAPFCPKFFYFKFKRCTRYCRPNYIPINNANMCRQKYYVNPICKKGYHMDKDGLCYEDGHDGHDDHDDDDHDHNHDH